MLDDALSFIVSDREAGQPKCNVWLWVDKICMALDHFSNGCYRVVPAVAESLLFLVSLGNFGSIHQTVKPRDNDFRRECSVGSILSQDSKAIACSLSQYTALLLSVSHESLSKAEPLRLEQLIAKELDHVVDQEDSKLEHILRLILDEDAGKDVVDQKACQI